jgi:Ca2+-binding EF-hand superfamily protein
MKLILGMMLAGVLLMTIGMPAAAQQNTAENAFASIDVNMDGKLSESEFAALLDPKAPDDQKRQEFARWDTDGDKAISKAEFAAQYSALQEKQPGQEKKR